MEQDHGYHNLRREDRGWLEFRLRSHPPHPLNSQFLSRIHLHRNHHHDVHSENATRGAALEQLNIDQTGGKWADARLGTYNQYSDKTDQRAPV